ncbi:EI24 domain-containing protein [Streptomyces sp. URMC 129]|uniref:EI24 domain-containing protein n=1 Tax=Streptomyces sp. URMC 129 TaxID=3423407 RepID=UPI003F1BABD5
MRDVMTGLRFMLLGQRWVLTHRRWFGFGLLPALVTLVIYAVALTMITLWSDDIVTWATPFADGWDDLYQALLRGLFAALLIGGALLTAVLTFTAVTLLIGDPFYEALSEQVEKSDGGPGDGAGPGVPWWTDLADSVRVLLRWAVFGVPLFFLGFVPLLGQTVVPAVGVAVTGFFLTIELTSLPLARRGQPLRERMLLFRTRPGLALGFGVPLALLFLIPVAAVVLMPGAVAGATLLARDATAYRALNAY